MIGCRSPARASHSRPYSGNNGGNCIETALGFISGVVPVRDSKDPQGPALLFSEAGFTSFIAAVKSGELPTV